MKAIPEQVWLNLKSEYKILQEKNELPEGLFGDWFKDQYNFLKLKLPELCHVDPAKTPNQNPNLKNNETIWYE